CRFFKWEWCRETHGCGISQEGIDTGNYDPRSDDQYLDPNQSHGDVCVDHQPLVKYSVKEVVNAQQGPVGLWGQLLRHSTMLETSSIKRVGVDCSSGNIGL